jgi:hypothetical protein
MGRDADILYTDDQFAYSGRVGGFVPHSMWVNIPSANDSHKEEVAFIWDTPPISKAHTVHGPLEITMADVDAVKMGYGQWQRSSEGETDPSAEGAIKFLLAQGYVLPNDDPAGHQAKSYYVPVWPPKFGAEYPVRQSEAHTRHVPWKSWAQSEFRERYLCAAIREMCEDCKNNRSLFILTWDHTEGAYVHSLFSTSSFNVNTGKKVGKFHKSKPLLVPVTEREQRVWHEQNALRLQEGCVRGTPLPGGILEPNNLGELTLEELRAYWEKKDREEMFVSRGRCPATHLHLLRKTHAPSQLMRREEEIDPIIRLLRSAQ